MPEYPTGGAGFSASDQKGNLIAPRVADSQTLQGSDLESAPCNQGWRFKRDPFKAGIGLWGHGVKPMSGKPKNEAEALRAVFAILSKHLTPSQKSIAALNVEATITGQRQSITAYRFEQLGNLLYPHSPKEAERFTQKISAAQDGGAFSTQIPIGQRGAFLSDLLAWPDFEGVPDDSPLKFWLDIPYHPKDTRKKPRDWRGEYQTAATPSKKQQIAREAFDFFGTQITAGQALGVSRQRVGSLLRALSESEPKKSSSLAPWDVLKRKR